MRKDGSGKPKSRQRTTELKIKIPEDAQRERIDRFLAKELPQFSRSQIQRWIDEGRAEQNGRSIRNKDKIEPGEVIRLRPSAPTPSKLVAQDIPLEVVYEDKDVIVVNKPPGMVVHPAAGHPDGTLVNALVHRFPDLLAHSLPEDIGRPGIVHRIDKDTFGLLVVARNQETRQCLVEQFQAHSVGRHYWAVVVGNLSSKTHFDTLHGRHVRDRKRFSGKVKRGKKAITHVQPIEEGKGCSLVECTLETGRTHQIRVHLSESGHPLVGDPVYGINGWKRSPLLRDAFLASGLPGQALFARTLSFSLPNGKSLHFQAKPPAALIRLASSLELNVSI